MNPVTCFLIVVFSIVVICKTLERRRKKKNQNFYEIQNPNYDGGYYSNNQSFVQPNPTVVPQYEGVSSVNFEKYQPKRLYLNVPYQQKDEAKALGAKYNGTVKKWYADKDYEKFSKWILKNTGSTLFASNYIFIVEGVRECWKCSKPTRVVCLGVSEYLKFFDYGEGVQYKLVGNTFHPELHIGWIENENKIPPKLLKYLVDNYTVKTSRSNTARKNLFSNHCEHCGALQGNNYLFDEGDPPFQFWYTDKDSSELIKQASELKIFGIPIEDYLQLNFDCGTDDLNVVDYDSTDYAYLKYGQYKELVLSDNPNNKRISYENLYKVD